MGTQFFFGQPDGFHQVVQALIFQGGQPQSLTNLVDHGQVFVGAVGGIFFHTLVVGAFEMLDGAAAGKIVGGTGGGEVQKFKYR